MADLSKLKKRLGPPPAMTETADILQAPETAPAAPEMPRRVGRGAEDGRSARKTGRTVQFATRVSPEFDKRFRAVAKRDKLLMVDLLERSLEAYEKQRG
ncbi:hypothetical protein [Rhodovulum sp. PH10]|uniref:hypothetical protein n=1 Tax=Rhodovulum sp. PH10 TaxID=1187851 RepID=UPI00058EE4A1|nr:hypothetical protein [Rhodovulum sp. PH10]